MRKLKSTEVTPFKQRLYRKQEGICPLCLLPLPKEPSKYALDHDHVTGEVRGVLHMGCNKAEGNIFNAVGRWGKVGKDYDAVIPYLERLLAYYQAPRSGVIYHLHKSPEEKEEQRRKRANARARARRRIQKEK